ncbi:MAG: MerR family transcriptional regulator [Bacteroidia bacterium]|nr:MerR family transcriptional regulator [Bacteroidia bacterium]
MRIGEVSKLTGFSADTLRWYEKIGLIERKQRALGESNYRIYDQAMIERLFAIRQLKSFGFTLKEIEELFLLDEQEGLQCTSLSELMNRKMKALEEKIKELQKMEAKLKHVADSCQGNCKEMLEI